MNRVLALVLISAFGAATVRPATAQDWGMSDVRTNMFVQTVGRLQPNLPDDGTVVNSISVPRVRFRARGQHETGLSFDLQADVVRSPALLDARISFPATDRITIDTGLYKTPSAGNYWINSRPGHGGPLPDCPDPGSTASGGHYGAKHWVAVRDVGARRGFQWERYCSARQ